MVHSETGGVYPSSVGGSLVGKRVEGGEEVS